MMEGYQAREANRRRRHGEKLGSVELPRCFEWIDTSGNEAR